jgi:exoribonuclease-2
MMIQTSFSLIFSLQVSYRGADEVLAGSTTHGAPAEVVKALQTLNRYAVTRRKYRESRGATIVQLPEPVLRIQNGGKVSLVLDNKESASRSLVEEMMILGGQVAAEYAKKHQIPMPYRVQEASEPQNSTSASSARASSPVKAASSNSNAASGSFVARVMAAAQQTGSQKPAFMDTIPRRHASIGLDAYVQATSPIRRYCDLLAHHQLKSHLRCPSDPLPFSSYDILTYRDVYESSVRQVEALQQSSVRYWLLKHLEERNAAAAPLKALILPRPGSASLLAGDVVNVFLMDFAFRVFTKLVRPHEYGDIISVNITRIDSIMLALDVIET